MIREERIAHKFLNTYNINVLLYRLSKIPLLGKMISRDIYASTLDKKVFSIIINIYTFIRNIIFKLLYYSIIYFSVLYLFKDNVSSSFIHVLIILTILGIFINTNLFVPGKKNYYFINLFKIDSYKYTFNTLVSTIFTSFILNGICLFIFSNILGFSYIYIILISIITSLSRLLSEVFGLLYYKYFGNILINNYIHYFTLIFIFLGLSYVLPYFNITINFNIIIVIMGLIIIFSILSINYLRRVKDFKLIYKRLNTKSVLASDEKNSIASIYEVDKKDYKIDDKKLEGKSGYDLFNTIFFLRHKKILMRSAVNYSIVIFVVAVGVIGYLWFRPVYKEFTYNFIINNFTWTLFIMYFLNRGSIVCGAMFYNCDRSMLKYNFYREESVILNNFKTRVKTVTKVNLLPAIVFSISLILILLFTKGNLLLLEYILIFISILIMSILFSIHYLVIYYLLQPYDEDMHMKSFSYTIVSFITYYICYLCTRYTFSIMRFSMMVVIISLVYLVVALLLVKKKAVFTFRLK